MCGWFEMRADISATDLELRRRFMRRGGAVTALLASGLWAIPTARASELSMQFDGLSVEETLKAWGGVRADEPDIVLTLPEVSENGAFVSVAVSSFLADTREIAIVVEKNPDPLVVRFLIPPGTEPFVSTRIKVAESGPVHAVVKAGGKLSFCTRNNQVVVGGCA